MRYMVGLGLFAATLMLSPQAHAAGKYDGWSGDDCVSMGKNCIGLCDKYGVPETKAGCMFNCAQVAMQCIDIVKGETAEANPGGTGPRGTRAPVRAPLMTPQLSPVQ